MKKISIILMAVLFFYSCNKNNSEDIFETASYSPPHVVVDQALANELKSNPEEIIIDGKELTLETFLARDFMPFGPVDGKPLICLIWFLGQEGGILSETISISKVYVVNKHEVWICDSFVAGVNGTIENPGQNRFEVDVWDGPKWGPNIDVDVICEFSSHLGQSFKLMAKSQQITKSL